MERGKFVLYHAATSPWPVLLLYESYSLMTKPNKLRVLVSATAIILLIVAFSILGQSVDFAELITTERLAATLDSAGPFAPLLLIVIMAGAVVISPIPSLPLDLAAGATFGPLLGAVYAVIGAEIGAILSFLIGRALGREVISRLLRVDVIFCEKCSDHKLMAVVFLARLVPIFSFDIISYGAGLTNMSLMTFAVATLLGMIPPTLALTYFGSSVVSAQLPLMLLATVMVAFFLFLPKLLMKYRSSWWAQLFMGPPPGEAAPSRSVAAVTPLTGESAQPCPACGGPMA